jgi:hypothetical protein
MSELHTATAGLGARKGRKKFVLAQRPFAAGFRNHYLPPLQGVTLCGNVPGVKTPG